jgi:hypothetical protein
MRALVVFESMFGNTQHVAEAIVEGINRHVAAELVEVNDAPRDIGTPDVDLLVIGGPTHALGMSRQKTRQDAMTQDGRDAGSAGLGMREWIGSLSRPSADGQAVAFDTRIDRPRIPGSAARAAERRLRKLGFRILAPAESYYVAGTPGPLVDGELDRARRWGEGLGASLAESSRRDRAR